MKNVIIIALTLFAAFFLWLNHGLRAENDRLQSSLTKAQEGKAPGRVDVRIMTNGDLWIAIDQKYLYRLPGACHGLPPKAMRAF